MREQLKISRPIVATDNSTTRISVELEGSNLPKELWFNVPSQYAPWLAIDRPDWIATSLLVPAMLRGLDIHCESPLSPRLLRSINHDLQYILHEQDSRLQKIIVDSNENEAIQPPKLHGLIGTGFSAGVDSFCTLFDYASEATPKAVRINALVTNNIGAMGAGESTSAVFDHYCKRTETYAKLRNMHSVSMDSNLAFFYRGDFSFQQTHTIRNISAILVVQWLFHLYYYSSTYRYNDLFVGSTYDMATADPTILSLLSTEQLEFISSGSQYTRWDKILRIVNLPDAQQMLDICAVDASEKKIGKFLNCGKCFKCARHLFSLELIGRLHEFENLFDMNAYWSERPHLIANILNSSPTSIAEREVVVAASALGKKIPLRFKVLASAKKTTPAWFSWRLGNLMNHRPRIHA